MTTTNSYQYSSVLVPDDGTAVETEQNNPPSPPPRNGTKTLIGSMVAGALLVVIVLVSASSSSSSTPAATVNSEDVPMIGKSLSKTRSCTFDECFAANCDFDTAPFICITNNGGPHMGCSPVKWTPETCEDDCDLSGCKDLDIPDDTKTCAGVKCGKEWCAGGQVCTKAAKYQCQDGSARFGCSDDPLQWTLRSDSSTCSKCCDASLC